MSLVIRELVLDTLFISPRNVRQDPGDLTELIDSIRDRGVLQPILVRQQGEEYEVIAGRRRLEAARIIGIPTIPAIELAGPDLEMILTSYIENYHRKDLTLAERVATYKVLQQCDPAYNNLDTLAEALSLSHKKTSHQKISQDFQADAVLRKLEPHGFTLASHLRAGAPERQEGKALPEYHLVLLHQAMASLSERGAVTEDDADEKLAELAHLIAPLSQAVAKELIEAVKAGEQPAHLTLEQLAEEHAPSRQFKAGRHGASRRRKSTAKVVQDGGEITCACCKQVLQLHHWSDGTHTITDTPFPGQPVLPEPDLPDEPIAAALPPAPVTADVATALGALETPPHVGFVGDWE